MANPVTRTDLHTGGVTMPSTVTLTFLTLTGGDTMLSPVTLTALLTGGYSVKYPVVTLADIGLAVQEICSILYI
jgi:hypothetical protein